MNAATPRQRAALRLASLGSKDRQWVMDRLSPSERSRIEPVLSTLPKCSPEALAVVMSDLDAVRGQPTAESDVGGGPQMQSMRLIEQASTRDLVPVLDELPIGFASLLAERWPQSGRHVLRAASGDHETRPAAGVTPAFVDLLLEVVEERLGPPSTEFEAILTADETVRSATGVTG